MSGLTIRFNPWWGCVHAGPECDNCYAEAFSHRLGRDLWGADKPRRPATERYWNDPFKWDVDAQRAGERRRVFCASMGDLLEDRRDLDAARDRLWNTIAATPFLDWLLLTKRPGMFDVLTPQHWRRGMWPRNAWAGTTCGTNAGLARVRTLQRAAAPAPVLFVSCEPMLERVDFHPVLYADAADTLRPINWLILGGESGARARPCDLLWINLAVAQAHHARVAVFVKQLGRQAGLKDPKGGDPAEWPPHLRGVREFPRAV